MKLLRKIKSVKNRLYCWWLYRGRYELQKFLHPSAVFLVLTPISGNLGDHAIAETEKAMLNDLGVKYIEMTIRQIYGIKNHLSVMNNRTIFVNGGGNLGTLWFDIETILRDILQSNPDSNVVLLPNTVVYEDSKWGREEFEKSKHIYNAHPRLTIYAREHFSYEIMKQAYKDVALVPDIVMSRQESDDKVTREGCIISLRRDHEKTRTDAEEDTIMASAERLFAKNVRFIDTDKDYQISSEDRNRELDEFFDEFRSAQLVITDRLHGMIFAAITGTPCIVINSRSPKVKGCYEWIKNLGYIKFCDDVNKIEEIYRSIPQGPHKYDNSHLQPYFDELKKDIIAKVKRRI